MFSINSDNLCRYHTAFIPSYNNNSVDTGGLWLLNAKDSTIIYEDSNDFSSYNWENNDVHSYLVEDKNIVNIQFAFVSESTADVIVIKEGDDKLNVYPNPVTMNNSITVPVEGTFQFYNLMGEMIQSGQIEDENIPVNINNSGLYLLKIRNVNGSIHTFKITVL